MMISKMRAKRSLLVEEVFELTSNSQIYINDHLTPYFNKLHQISRMAKRDGKLATTSAIGGKIRVRKCIDDVSIHITTESQLRAIIDIEITNNSTVSSLATEGTNNISQSSTASTSTRASRSSSKSATAGSSGNAENTRKRKAETQARNPKPNKQGKNQTKPPKTNKKTE